MCGIRCGIGVGGIGYKVGPGRRIQHHVERSHCDLSYGAQIHADRQLQIANRSSTTHASTALPQMKLSSSFSCICWSKVHLLATKTRESIANVRQQLISDDLDGLYRDESAELRTCI